MALIGYARISTMHQDLDMQINALEKAGCIKIFHEQASGAKEERKELRKCIEYLREGDCLVVWRLDRLARSLKQLLELMKHLEANNIEFKSLTEKIDTTSPEGKLYFHIFASMIQFERDAARDRSIAGLERARARGRVGGRPSKLNSTKKELLLDMYLSKKYTYAEIAQLFNICVNSVYKITRDMLKQKDTISNL